MTHRRPTFRLLDARVGWQATMQRIASSDGGLALAPVDPGAVDPERLAAWLPPARLAWAHRRRAWYLVTPYALLRWEPTRRDFATPGADASRLKGGTAVAARHHRVAVSRLLENDVCLFARDGAEFVARVAVRRPGPLVVRPDGETWVVERITGRIRRISPEGHPRGWLPVHLPPGRAERFTVAPDRSLWLLTRDGGRYHLWQGGAAARRFEPSTLDAARNALDETGVVTAGKRGFTASLCHPDGGDTTLGRDWDGAPLIGEPTCGRSRVRRAERAQLIAGPIDSGIPRCRWHRVRIDAELPPHTRIEVAVATLDRPQPVGPCVTTRVDAPEWLGFAEGPIHPDDWQVSDALDLLVDQPPGRYLYVRIRLEGDGLATPTLHGARLDFPRLTALEHLPGVYRRDPDAEDFTERYLTLFDATIEDTDRAFERSPSLLDVARTPAGVLDWLAGLLDVRFGPRWDDERRRALLAAVPDLYRLRGTPAALRRALSLVLGVEPAVDDLSRSRRPGVIGSDARLGGVYLFGRHRRRVRLDASRLGSAPLMSHGDPIHDAHAAHAHRIAVSVPRVIADAIGRDRIAKAVQALQPAHVHSTLRYGHSHFVVGLASMVGIDSLLQQPPRPILGGPRGNVYLGRQTVLRPPRHGRRAGLDLGHGGLHRVGTRIE